MLAVGAQIQFLVGKIRSHKPSNTAPKKVCVMKERGDNRSQMELIFLGIASTTGVWEGGDELSVRARGSRGEIRKHD